jgi:multiple sugar transport system ATP-binding protein
MALIETVDLWKTYVMGSEEIHALRGVSISIERGEYVAIMGPSGSGKSTLMNLIGCLDTPSKGSYLLNGKQVSQMNDNELARIRNEEIGFVFQTFNLLPRATALHNVELPLVYAGVGSDERRRRAIEALGKVQLQDRMDHRPNELSGGQRQRVAIGRALVRDAGVFLFDEPLSNLDAQLRSELRVEIKRLHQRLGATMIYVTHDQIEALTLADRIAVMKDRTFQQIGTPQEIYLRPVNRFVATFVGSPAMNFVPGRIEGGGTPVFRSASLRLPVPGYKFAQAPADGAPVELGIRPEHVILAPDASDAQEVSVEMSEPMGSDLLAWTRLGDLPLSIRLPAETMLTPGDRLRILLPENRLNLFDAANGARL